MWKTHYETKRKKIKKIELRKLWDGKINELWQLEETQKVRKM